MRLNTPPAEKDEPRADLFLSRMLPDLSRSAVQKLFEEDLITLNDVPISKKKAIKIGQTLSYPVAEEKNEVPMAQDIPLDIRFEDDSVLVINKPVGMVVHPAPGHLDGTLVNALLHHCGAENLSSIGGQMRPGIVHRIDRDTSGLILVAKTDAAHLHLKAQLENHSLSRIYQAIIIGAFHEDGGTIRAPIARHGVNRKKMAVDFEKGKDAITHWETIARYNGYTHIQCRLETGRTHQIRVHMAHKGHPILGDMVYGRRTHPLLSGQCLHAKSLTFLHPETNHPTTITCDLPTWFEALLSKLKKEE